MGRGGGLTGITERCQACDGLPAWVVTLSVDMGFCLKLGLLGHRMV